MDHGESAQKLIDGMRARSALAVLAAQLRGRQIGVKRIVLRDPLMNLATGSVEVPFFESDARASDSAEVRALAPTPPKPMREPGQWLAEHPLDEEDLEAGREFAGLLERNTDAVMAALDESGLAAERGDAEAVAAVATLAKMRGKALGADFLQRTAAEFATPKPEGRHFLSESLRRRAGIE